MDFLGVEDISEVGDQDFMQSTKPTTTKHQFMFDDILHLNDYSENSVNHTETPQEPSERLWISQHRMIIPQDILFFN